MNHRDKCLYIHVLPNWQIFYVGIGSEKRAFSKSNRNKHWKEIVEKYPQYHVHIVLDNLTMFEAAEFEIEMIRKIGLSNLSNVSSGGIATAQGMKHTDEAKRKISINSGSKRAEVKEKHRFNALGYRNNMYGKTHTIEAREKIRKARSGSKASNITKLKMSENKKGCKNSSHIKKIYCFINTKTWEVVFLTPFDFRQQYKLNQSCVSMLINRKRKSVNSWILGKSYEI